MEGVVLVRDQISIQREARIRAKFNEDNAAGRKGSLVEATWFYLSTFLKYEFDIEVFSPTRQRQLLEQEKERIEQSFTQDASNKNASPMAS